MEKRDGEDTRHATTGRRRSMDAMEVWSTRGPVSDHNQRGAPESETAFSKHTSDQCNQGYLEDEETEVGGQPTVPGAPDTRRRHEDADNSSSCMKAFETVQNLKDKFLTKSWPVVYRVAGVLLLLLYFAYTGYALYLQWGTESAARLGVLLAIVVLWLTSKQRRQLWKRLRNKVKTGGRSTRMRTVIRWILYLVTFAGIVVYLIMEVLSRRPANLVCLAGIAILLTVSLLLSTDLRQVNWHAVFWGLALQFYLAVFILRTRAGMDIFQWLGNRINDLLASTDEGSAFIFGKDTYTLHPFVFKLMPVILFSNALITVLYHVGAIQAVIATLGRFLSFCLGTSPVESVNAAANIFFSLTESTVLVRPYLSGMSESEMFAIMTGGFSSLAGSHLAIIISLGVPAEHLLAATVMSAPAALAIAKVMCPENKDRDTGFKQSYKIVLDQSKNLLEALSNSTVVGVSIVVSICANILIFIALLDVVDSSFVWFGLQVGLPRLSFTRILSYLFYPLMYVLGVDSEDLMVLGRLVSVKILLTPLIAYMQTSDIIHNTQAFNDYRLTTNGSWHSEGDDLILDGWNKTLVGGVMNERSIMLSTYVLCGFCNVGGIAICMGVMTTVIPQRISVITRHVVRAFIGGNIACFLTGCVAGLIFI